MKERVCVIMQPSYLPWAGYFNLICEADVFIFLDDAQFEKQSWQHRNRVLVNGNPHWLTVPVYRERLPQTIREVKIADNTRWRKKHVRLLEQAYGKHPRFGEIRDVLNIMSDPSIDRIVELNITIIRRLCGKLDLVPSFHRSGELGVEGQRSERLLRMCEHFGCTTYLSPVGSAEYLEQDGVFHNAAMQLRFQNYTPRKYPQKGAQDFVGYLSVLDVIANIGCEATKNYIRSNHKQEGGSG